MKPIVEHPSPASDAEPVLCEVVRGKDFGCVWHYHPESEITLVTKGGTERMVGDQITPLQPGDLVFLGPNLPHDFRNQPAPGAPHTTVEAIVVQFIPRLPWLEDWLHRSSMQTTRRLLERSCLGLEVTGNTRQTAARMMQSMLETQGLKRVILLLQLLDMLANSQDLREICPVALPARQPGDVPDRAGIACEYIKAHLAEPIYVEDLAGLVGLGKSAFSRLFKSSTGRTVPQYVNELRIVRACQLLAETDLTVTQISFECGFVSPAHFQRQFRTYQLCVPSVYRMRVRQTI